MSLKKPERNIRASILLVEDHAFVRKGLTLLINDEPDMIVTGEAADAKNAFHLVTTTAPDLIITDIGLPGANGIELIKKIRALGEDVRILVISMHDERVYARRALQAGARGYIMKAATSDQLIIAIRTIITGNMYISEQVKEQMICQMMSVKPSPELSPVDQLTDRELEILQLIGEGRTTKEIAKGLQISVKTVETHRGHIKEKLNLANGPELTRFAIQWVDKGYSGN